MTRRRRGAGAGQARKGASGRQSGGAPDAGAMRMNISARLHQTAGDDLPGDGGAGDLRPVRLRHPAGQRTAQRRFPHHQCAGQPAGRRSGNHGLGGGDAAGECLRLDPGPGLHDLASSARATPTSPCSSGWTATSTPPPRTCRRRFPACCGACRAPCPIRPPCARTIRRRSRSSSSRSFPTPCRSPRSTSMPAACWRPSFPPWTASPRSTSSARRAMPCASRPIPPRWRRGR